MSDPASITLSPCPFCGGEGRTSKFTAAVVRQPWRALCMNDDCPMELHCDFTTEADAIAAWNTRAALAQPARAQAGVAEFTLARFHNALRILTSIDGHELPSDVDWPAFRADPVRWLIRADDASADAIWAIVERRME